ncbi:lipopolysaccharide biosynthesis protein [Kouleothrix sp.]|uniref:lipopolysaccharide biosynthesis protein n=1 Tax=Kouleothrix sp. TaxID=2779161 RepID=UPI00391D4DEE
MTPEPLTTKPPSLGTQVSRAVLWNVLFVPLRMISEIAATLIKLTVLAPASYGILSLISATNNGLGTWIDLGTGRALPKFIPETNHAGGRRAVSRLLLAVLGAQIALLLASGAAIVLLRERYFDYLRGLVVHADKVPPADQQRLLAFVGQSGWALIAAILAVLLFGIFYDVLMAYLSSFFKQRAWNSITLAAQLMPPLLTAAVILAGWDIGGVVAVMVFAPAVATALVGWQVLRHQRQLADRPAGAGSERWLPPGFARYCGVSFLMTATDYLASAGFAAFFAQDAIEIAVLMAGVNIVKVVLAYLYTPMVGVQVPLFTRVRQGEGGTLNGAYQSLIRLQVLLLVPGGVGLMLLARPIFALLQARYVDAAPLVWILVPCLFLESLLTTAHNALIVYEKLRVIVVSRLLTLVCVPLVVLLFPVLGGVGAALAFGLARVLAGVWATANGYRLLGLRWPWRFSGRVALASAALALVAGLLGARIGLPAADASRVARLALLAPLLGIAAAGALAFLAVLRLLGGLDAQDRRQLAQMKLPLKRWLLRIL